MFGDVFLIFNTMGFWSKLFGFGKKASSSCCGGSCKKDMTADLSLIPEDKEAFQKMDEKILVGKVISVESHPDPKITKVRVSQVSFGGDPVQILCGGVNLEEDQIVPVATVGAKLSEDFEIGVRKIRGVESNGMICARAELGVSPADEKKGEIWELPKDLESCLGKPLKKLLS